MKLAGKIALVTGSSKGIGAAIARKFAMEGASVVVNYRSSEAEAKKLAARILKEGGREVTLVRADISQEADREALFREVGRRFGRLDVLVNNAGASDGKIWNSKVSEITTEMWPKVFGVDVYGTFFCSQRAVPLMKRGGSIINIASTPVLTGDTQGLVYACAKASVFTMTKMLSRMLAPKVRVNCMILGSIETTWVDWLDKETLERYRSEISLARLGKPEEVANVAAFLASEESSYVNGQGIVVDGGEVLD
jgi:3-oxoacyl-[acyl-carrier protein] reductase